jgi:hypothetical protein
VICPGATLWGPPPGKLIANLIVSFELTYYENSKMVPLASPNNAPIMHPIDASSLSIALIYSYLVSSNYVYIVFRVSIINW